MRHCRCHRCLRGVPGAPCTLPSWHPPGPRAGARACGDLRGSAAPGGTGGQGEGARRGGRASAQLPARLAARGRPLLFLAEPAQACRLSSPLVPRAGFAASPLPLAPCPSDPVRHHAARPRPAGAPHVSVPRFPAGHGCPFPSHRTIPPRGHVGLLRARERTQQCPAKRGWRLWCWLHRPWEAPAVLAGAVVPRRSSTEPCTRSAALGWIVGTCSGAASTWPGVTRCARGTAARSPAVFQQELGAEPWAFGPCWSGRLAKGEEGL